MNKSVILYLASSKQSNKSMRFILLFFFMLQTFLITAQDESEITINDDLQLIPITENVYLHRSYKTYPMGRFSSNGVVYVVDDEAIIIDTPVTDSLTSKLIHWFTQKGILFLAVIPTHWHDDCLGGLGAAHSAGIKSYGLDMTIELAKEHEYVSPQIGFNDSITMKIKGQEIECKYLGAGHTIDNIVVWIPTEKVLFGGCMIKALSARGLGNISDADTTTWPQTVSKIKNAFPDIDYVIPGHGAVGGRELLDYTYQLLTNQ
jgi:metallo-beta-lactamase class B